MSTHPCFCSFNPYPPVGKTICYFHAKRWSVLLIHLTLRAEQRGWDDGGVGVVEMIGNILFQVAVVCDVVASEGFV